MKRTLTEVAAVTGGRLTPGGAGVAGPFMAVSTDTRTLESGALFVALRGPNFDGGEFVAAAAARGAIGALVSRSSAAPLTQIVVPDTLLALQKMAQAWRANFNIPVVGVAGSNGKTTTKEMIAAILSKAGACLSTRGNLNNHIGVPLTMMRLDQTHRSAVIEMGANRVGDVAELVTFVKPTVAIVTNAGAEHLEGFGDMDGVAKGEGEAVATLGAAGTAVINADDAYADYWRGVARASKIVSFGVKFKADFVARDAVQTIEAGQFATRFTLLTPAGERQILLRAGGSHNLTNAVAAAAAASAAGATLDDIVGGLESFRAVAGRLQLKAGMRNSWIIDDSYNANPSSVRAGLDVLRDVGGTIWLVLGDMAELGEHALQSHVEAGRYARDCGVKRLFAIGPESSRAAEAFGAGAEWFPDADSLIRRLTAEVVGGVTLLIKGSRVNRLERVVQALTGTSGAVPDKAN
jgi:UDP-N-acetylmuramoyl-tripeptide--D-alanyl-D-alanine ligase